MNDKTKIYDYACGVVNCQHEVLFKRTDPRFNTYVRQKIVYNISDAVHEHRVSYAGGEFLVNFAKHQLSGNPYLEYQESLITHVVSEFTKLINDGYTMEVK